MRKRRIWYVGALGLALAAAVPATASAAGTQNFEAGFQPQKNANVVFGQPANLSGKFSKKGTLRTNLFLDNFTDDDGDGDLDAPSLQVADVHLPDEMKINGKGLKTCKFSKIEGDTPEQARAACKKSLVGSGLAKPFGLATTGTSLLFHGPNKTILVHIQAAVALPPITLVGKLQNSALGSPYGQVLHVPVSETAGGTVPSGVVVERTELTKISKTFTVKKKGKKKKKNYVSAKCTDGTLSYRTDFLHADPDPDQSVPYEQPCTS